MIMENSGVRPSYKNFNSFQKISRPFRATYSVFVLHHRLHRGYSYYATSWLKNQIQNLRSERQIRSELSKVVINIHCMADKSLIIKYLKTMIDYRYSLNFQKDQVSSMM